MRQHLNEILPDSLDVICGDISSIPKAYPLQPFSTNVIKFLNALSKKLVVVREYSDVVTFGFWCRKGALLKEKLRYDDLHQRLGRGIAFHVAPSNVPVNFAFSLVAGLLAGNANIVRLPTKDFPQTKIITQIINELLAYEFSELSPYICLVRYPINKDISDIISAVTDIRIIWGGDATITKLRESPLKPRAGEITFADRYSIAVIKSDTYLLALDKDKIARDFYNDTYFSDQNACTSPRVIFWLGDKRSEAKSLFYSKLHEIVVREYSLLAVQSVGKLAAFYRSAIGINAILEPSTDNLIMRVKIDKLSEEMVHFKYNSGFFFECDIDFLEQIKPVCGERCQTLSYYGISSDEITQFIMDSHLEGIDRVVPIGKTMDFALIWDGHDLIREMSRMVGVF